MVQTHYIKRFRTIAKKMCLHTRIRMHRSRAFGSSNLLSYRRFCATELLSVWPDPPLLPLLRACSDFRIKKRSLGRALEADQPQVSGFHPCQLFFIYLVSHGCTIASASAAFFRVVLSWAPGMNNINYTMSRAPYVSFETWSLT